MWNHLDVFLQCDPAGHLLPGFFFWREQDLAVHKLVVGAVAEAELGKLGPLHQPVDVPQRFFAGKCAYFRFTAHYDRFFGTRVNTETTEDTAKHIDVEAGRIFLDQRVGMLSRFDVDTVSRASCRAHVTRDAPGRSVFTRRQNM